MRTLSIFDGGFTTYPTIFKKSKPVLDETLIRNKTFCLSPDRKKVGSVTNLKNNLGIKVGGVFTFKTSFISGKEKYLYNGHNLKLKVVDKSVSIVVSEGVKSLKLDCWDLAEITKMFSIKNPKCNFITDTYIIDLIEKGRLKVKFKVGADKNHGTDWKLD